MDKGLLLALAEAIPDIRVFHVSSPSNRKAPEEQAFEYLVIVPERMKGSVSAVLSRHAEKPCVDIASSERPPSYLHRCREIPLGAILSELRSRRRDDEQREEAKQKALEEQRTTLLPLVILVVTPNPSLASSFETVLRRRFPDAFVTTAARPEIARYDARLDGALVDASLPDWGGVRGIDWLQGAGVATECIGLVVSAPADEPAWSRVRERGVLRMADVETEIDKLLDGAQRRNLARLARWDEVHLRPQR